MRCLLADRHIEKQYSATHNMYYPQQLFTRPFILVFCVLSICFGSTAHAQFSGLGLGGEVEIRTTPEYPNAYETVTVRLEAFGKNMTGATINWKKNGSPVAEAKNARSLTLTTGALGSRTQIGVSLVLSDGTTVTKSYTLTPSDVDIILEADTYVPEGYLGRALPSYGSQVRAIAVPHLYKNGVALKPSEVVYTWDLNGAALEGGPQLGRQMTEFTIPNFGRTVIGVKATSRDGTILVRRAESVNVVAPEIAFYEENTLFGRSFLSFTQLVSSKTEVTMRAVPYFLNNDLKDGGQLEYVWSLDGKKLANQGGNPFLLTLEDTVGGGQASGNFSFRSQKQVLQSASGDFQVKFNGANFGAI